MKGELSTRELEVARLVRQGKPDKVIAHELGISIFTVRNHIQEAAAKIPGTASRRWRLVFFVLNEEKSA